MDALVSDINAAKVDLVVVSGDLTQRAFGHQFRAARRMLEAFDAPHLVVPGNHDVYPWWRFFSRLFDPLRRYKRLIEPNLAPSWRNGDVVVQGINSAFGWTVQGGRITGRELAQIQNGFSDVPNGAPGDALKVLVVHHHLAELIALAGHDIARGAERAFDTARRAGVDLILCGHLHIAHIASVGKHPVDGIIVATAGTCTSNRGRGSNKAVNHYNLIDVADGELKIEERVYQPDAERFAPIGEHLFER